MAQYTMQEAFDIAWLHALSLPHQSRGVVSVLKNNPDLCAYRSADGLRCFVGVLINDCDYNHEFEGKSASELPVEVINIVGVDEKKRGEFLDHLQSAHDRSRVSGEWFIRLKLVAGRYGLDYAKHDELEKAS